MTRLRVPGLRAWVVGSKPQPAAPGFRSAWVGVVDLEDLPEVLLPVESTGRGYVDAMLLVREQGRPLGLLRLDLTGPEITKQALHRRIDADFSRRGGGAMAVADPLPPMTVVVPTCRRPDDLERCVTSVLASTHQDLQVIVIDNAPADASTAQRVRDAFGREPRVRYLAEPVPGASRARTEECAPPPRSSSPSSTTTSWSTPGGSRFSPRLSWQSLMSAASPGSSSLSAWRAPCRRGSRPTGDSTAATRGVASTSQDIPPTRCCTPTPLGLGRSRQRCLPPGSAVQRQPL